MEFPKFGGQASGQSGVEMMLRNMGLGSVLDAAKQLAESGAVEKIIQFADDAENIRNDLAQIKDALGIKPDFVEGEFVQIAVASEAAPIGIRGAKVEPGGSAGTGGSR